MKKIIFLFFTGFSLFIFKDCILIESFIIASIIFFATQSIKKTLKKQLKNKCTENKLSNTNAIFEDSKSKNEEINYLKELKNSLIETKEKEKQKQKVYKK